MKRLLVALLTAASLLGAMLAPPALLSTPAMAACSDAGVLGITHGTVACKKRYKVPAKLNLRLMARWVSLSLPSC